MKITNNNGISLPIAVWLLHDEYDYIDKPNYISVTRLMRPIRHLILPNRIPFEEREADVEDFIARAFGNSVHDSMEKAWLKNPQKKLRLLGYPDDVIDRVLVNPEPKDIKPDSIVVYLEQRSFTEFNEYTIGGKFDMSAEGIVQDTKSTSAFAWVNGTRDEDNILQMSLYRWLESRQDHPKITEDHGAINYVFTDWQKAQARSNPKYPQRRVENKPLPLLSLAETEDYIVGKLALIEKYKDTAEPKIPECTDEELWRSSPQYKYYSDPEKAKDPTARSSKNFDTLAEANNYWKMEKGGKGIVITKPGEVKRCGHCDAFDICTQKDRYIQ